MTPSDDLRPLTADSSVAVAPLFDDLRCRRRSEPIAATLPETATPGEQSEVRMFFDRSAIMRRAVELRRLTAMERGIPFAATGMGPALRQAWAEARQAGPTLTAEQIAQRSAERAAAAEHARREQKRRRTAEARRRKREKKAAARRAKAAAAKRARRRVKPDPLRDEGAALEQAVRQTHLVELEREIVEFDGIDPFAPREPVPTESAPEKVHRRQKREYEGAPRRSPEEETLAFQTEARSLLGKAFGGPEGVDAHMQRRFHEYLLVAYANVARVPFTLAAPLPLDEVRETIEGFGGFAPLPDEVFDDAGRPIIAKAFDVLAPEQFYRGFLIHAARQVGLKMRTRELTASGTAFEAWVMYYLEAAQNLFYRAWSRVWERHREAKPSWRPSGKIGGNWDWTGDPAAEEWVVRGTTEYRDRVTARVKEEVGYSRDVTQMSPAVRMFLQLRNDYARLHGLGPRERLPKAEALKLATCAFALYRRQRLALTIAQDGRVTMAAPDAGEIFFVAESVERGIVQGTYGATSLADSVGDDMTIGDTIAAPGNVEGEGVLTESVMDFFRAVQNDNPAEDYAYLYYVAAAASPASTRRTVPQFMASLRVPSDQHDNVLAAIADRLCQTFAAWARRNNLEFGQSDIRLIRQELMNPSPESTGVFRLAGGVMPPPAMKWGAMRRGPMTYSFPATTPAEERALRQTLLISDSPARQTAIEKEAVVAEMTAGDRKIIESRLPRYIELVFQQTEEMFRRVVGDDRRIPSSIPFTNEGLRILTKAARVHVKTQLAAMRAEVDTAAAQGALIPLSSQEVLRLDEYHTAAVDKLLADRWRQHGITWEDIETDPALVREAVEVARAAMAADASAKPDLQRLKWCGPRRRDHGAVTVTAENDVEVIDVDDDETDAHEADAIAFEIETTVEIASSVR